MKKSSIILILFLCLISVKADNDSSNFKNIEGIAYITLDDVGEISDSIKLDNSQISTILNGLILNKISSFGACNYLCGQSGIYIKFKVIEWDIKAEKNFAKKKINIGNFSIDFGYGCQETKEACLEFNGKNAEATFIYSYDLNTFTLLDNIWKEMKEKHKDKLKENNH
jgi:hypothetical protein